MITSIRSSALADTARPNSFAAKNGTLFLAGDLSLFYQLGAVLHDLLMRRPLFDGYEPEANLIDAVLRVVPDVRGTEEQQDLVRLCKACLQKDPALRLQAGRVERL